jgi:hypothetical protein
MKLFFKPENRWADDYLPNQLQWIWLVALLGISEYDSLIRNTTFRSGVCCVNSHEANVC